MRPPENRLEALARFYATRRSIEKNPPRALPAEDLTEAELVVRQELLDEFLGLVAHDESPGSHLAEDRVPLAFPRDTIGGGPWWFKDQAPVTIICARLPTELTMTMPYANPDNPDYTRFYTIADVDALVELHGHIRAVNRASHVEIRAVDELKADDLTTHLVLLGGVDWNAVTEDLTSRLHLPVRQQARLNGDAFDSSFDVEDDGGRRTLSPSIERHPDGVTLKEDIAFFYRGISPYNVRRTVTICNGMFARGTLGAVRTLTDRRFRDRNEGYLSERFAQGPTYGILSRVAVVGGETLTPDWTDPQVRLFEWSGSPS